MANEKEKQIRDAEAVLETSDTEGYKILTNDINEEISRRRDELETPVIENNRDDYIKGQINSLRWILNLPNVYRKVLKEK